MNAEVPTQTHIAITATLLRLYTFLTQHLDRTLAESARDSYADSELQAHLETARAEVLQQLAVNRVVKHKIEDECTRVLTLSSTYLADGAGKSAVQEELRTIRAVLKNKIMALSDLLAVFRAA